MRALWNDVYLKFHKACEDCNTFWHCLFVSQSTHFKVFWSPDFFRSLISRWPFLRPTPLITVVAAWRPTTQNKFRCARELLAPSVLGDLFTSAEYLPVMKTVANQRAQQPSYMSCAPHATLILCFLCSPKNLTTPPPL